MPQWQYLNNFLTQRGCVVGCVVGDSLLRHGGPGLPGGLLLFTSTSTGTLVAWHLLGPHGPTQHVIVPSTQHTAHSTQNESMCDSDAAACMAPAVTAVTCSRGGIPCLHQPSRLACVTGQPLRTSASDASSSIRPAEILADWEHGDAMHAIPLHR